MKDTYNVRKVWDIVKKPLTDGFPPQRSKLFTFIHVYGEQYVPSDEYATYLIEAYDLFRDDILPDGFLNLLEFATMVAGCGSDNLMGVIRVWGNDSQYSFTRVPSTIEHTVYDTNYLCNLIDSALKKLVK